MSGAPPKKSWKSSFVSREWSREDVAIGAREAAVGVEPGSGVAREHLAPQVRVVTRRVIAREDVREVRRKDLQEDLVAILFVLLPQLPSSRAFGVDPAGGVMDYFKRTPLDRSKWKSTRPSRAVPPAALSRTPRETDRSAPG